MAHPSDEIIAKAKAFYERNVKASVEADRSNFGKMLVARDVPVMDADTGAYEVADDILLAVDRLKERYPQARPFAIRIGFPTTARIEAGTLK